MLTWTAKRMGPSDGGPGVSAWQISGSSRTEPEIANFVVYLRDSGDTQTDRRSAVSLARDLARDFLYKSEKGDLTTEAPAD